MTERADTMDAAMRGDRQALGALLAAEGPALTKRVHGQIPERLRTLLGAEDIVQETFTDAVLAIRSFRPTDADSFASWLWTLARNNLVDAVRLVDAARRGGGRTRLSLADPDASYAQLSDLLLAASITSPSSAAVRTEDADALRSAIGALPEPHRTVVEQYDLHGRSAEDLAAELDRTPGAVYLLRNRAHRRLRERLLRG